MIPASGCNDIIEFSALADLGFGNFIMEKVRGSRTMIIPLPLILMLPLFELFFGCSPDDISV
jgi:hypothetical protein